MTTTHIEDVQPLKTREAIADMKWSLRKWCGERDYIMFIIGINSGLRISDLLKLKTEDLKGKKSIKIQEKKTKKPRTIHLDSIYDEIQSYIADNPSEWMFPSRQGTKPISPTQAYRQLVKAGEMVDIDSMGTHTMRKTFGFWHYKQHGNIAMLQGILNHSSSQITLRYIGITEEEERESIIALNL
ncbi:site-specific integrase [Sporosarcina sp. P37]|uniref:tyrosine-type recombinase/integrase n=1 Tax=unclassified Sporosarcina TaxID=2647733 RepID=UPI000A17F8B4|nr:MULTISPECIES: tyrosine-type recombinase/integrase [unclassified Sporosarcina]ARK23661.1 site-specific integrase [Sporosarcina sp. P37]PID18714.1 site-specific integrase [Sporosarcina sp. P35]